MLHVFHEMKADLKKKKKILRYVQISQPIMIYLKKLF